MKGPPAFPGQCTEQITGDGRVEHTLRDQTQPGPVSVLQYKEWEGGPEPGEEKQGNQEDLRTG